MTWEEKNEDCEPRGYVKPEPG